MICALTMLILAVPRLRARNPRAERIFVRAALLALFAVSLTLNLRIIREYSEIMNGPKPAREARKEKLETAADILYWPFGKSVMIEAEIISDENGNGSDSDGIKTTVMRSAESGSLFSAENARVNLPFSFRIRRSHMPENEEKRGSRASLFFSVIQKNAGDDFFLEPPSLFTYYSRRFYKGT